MSETINKLFTEIFRPKTVEQMILVPRIRNEVSKGLVCNYLFYSTMPGTGKTSITRILSSNYDTLYINGSAERGIDIIRDKIINFSSTISLEHGSEKLKVIVLEECDGLTEEAWKALRAVIEKYADSVRFILNCNYIQKIPEPIQSRFNCIHMCPINKDEEDYLFNEYVKRVLLILNHKSIGINSNEETVKEFVKIDFPDFRSILNKIQSLYIQGKKELTLDSIASSYDFSSLFDLIIGKPDAWENYKTIVSEYSNRVDEALIEIGKKFPEYLRMKDSSKIGKLPLILITIAEHQHQANFVPDKMITMLSLIYKIQIILAQ